MLGQGDAGTFEGTLAYAGPEQLPPGSSSPPGTDLYSLGVIAFELITGKRPFEAAEVQDETDRSANDSSIQAGFFEPAQFTRNLVKAVLEAPPPRLCDFTRLPRALEDMILQLLEKDPAKRPESAKAVANALQAIRSSPSLPKSTVTTQELLVNAAHAPKADLAASAAPRLATFSVAVGESGGVALPPEAFARAPQTTPLPLVQSAPRPLTPVPVLLGRARTPTPPRDARVAGPVATDRLPSAPGYDRARVESRIAAGLPSSAAPVGTFEPLVERPRVSLAEADDDAEGANPRQRLVRRIALACAGLAAVLVCLGGVAVVRRGEAPSAAASSPRPSEAGRGLEPLRDGASRARDRGGARADRIGHGGAGEGAGERAGSRELPGDSARDLGRRARRERAPVRERRRCEGARAETAPRRRRPKAFVRAKRRYRRAKRDVTPGTGLLRTRRR